MVDGTLARVYDSENDSWVDTTEKPGQYRLKDIMILVSSHARVPLLIKALEEHGVPAYGRKTGFAHV